MKCADCLEGKHEDCIDNVPIHDGEDARAFFPLCSCEEGECAPQLSYACSGFLHNCPGCPCSCHNDKELRAAWKKVHSAWVDQMLSGNKNYGPKSVTNDEIVE